MSHSDKPLQFGIRHLLGAMFLVSLAAALIAPWVRGWSAGQWLTLGIQSAVVASSFGLYLAYDRWTRRVVRGRIGAIQFRVRAKTWGQNAWQPYKAYGSLGCATVMLFFFTAVTIVSGARTQGPYMHGIYAGVFAAIGVIQLCYPPDEMLIGEQGMAMGGWQFVPWERVAYAYQPEHSIAPIFIKTAGWAWELFVSPPDTQRLVSLLESRAKVWSHPPQRLLKVQPS